VYESLEIENEWTQAQASLRVTLPLAFQYYLYSINTSLRGGYGQVQVSNKDYVPSDESSDDTLELSTSGFYFSIFKNISFLSITPRLGLDYSLSYTNLKAQDKSLVDNFSTYHKSSFFLPGISKSHSIKVLYNKFSSQDDYQAYDLSALSDPINSYLLARGYDRYNMNNFQKSSLNYYSPLWYPRFGIYDWVYFNRIYSNLFFDHSKIEDDFEKRSLNSYGLELFFNSTILRKLPIEIFTRVGQKIEAKESFTEIGISLSGQF
jgi:hypothetical protein